jgi:hypothetical protein
MLSWNWRIATAADSLSCMGRVYHTRAHQCSFDKVLVLVSPRGGAPIEEHVDGIQDVVRLQKAARAPWVAVTCRVPRPGKRAEASTPAAARRVMARLDVSVKAAAP